MANPPTENLETKQTTANHILAQCQKCAIYKGATGGECGGPGQQDYRKVPNGFVAPMAGPRVRLLAIVSPWRWSAPWAWRFVAFLSRRDDCGFEPFHGLFVAFGVGEQMAIAIEGRGDRAVPQDALDSLAALPQGFDEQARRGVAQIME